jgi:hypothetical protein
LSAIFEVRQKFRKFPNREKPFADRPFNRRARRAVTGKQPAGLIIFRVVNLDAA